MAYLIIMEMGLIKAKWTMNKTLEFNYIRIKIFCILIRSFYSQTFYQFQFFITKLTILICVQMPWYYYLMLSIVDVEANYLGEYLVYYGLINMIEIVRSTRFGQRITIFMMNIIVMTPKHLFPDKSFCK